MTATRRKLLILILLGAAVLAILALAASLARVEFAPGEPFTLENNRPLTPGLAGAPAELSPAMRLLLRIWLTMTLALLPFSIFFLILSPNARRRIIPNLIVFGMFMLIMSSLSKPLGQMLGEGGALEGLSMTGLTEGGAVGQPAEFTGSAPGWLLLLVSFILAAIMVAAGARLLYALVRSRRRPAAASLARIGEEAESAMTAIAEGGDLRDTVIRCYVEMNRVANEAHGILRQKAMTAREFEEQLERAGLPGDSVRDLTRIFEAVRYGAKDLGPGAEERAIACLSAIADSVPRALIFDCRFLIFDF